MLRYSFLFLLFNAIALFRCLILKNTEILAKNAITSLGKSTSDNSISDIRDITQSLPSLNVSPWAAKKISLKIDNCDMKLSEGA